MGKVDIVYLQELVRNGPTVYPGSRYVVSDTGERIDLRYGKRADAFLSDAMLHRG
jgi:DNA-directed RNA polymerase II subunit RPB1